MIRKIRGYISNDRSKPIPRYYYMALLFKKGDSFKAIAFWMEHTDSPKSTKLVDYALSIDELEEKTGIDFFPSLNTRVRDKDCVKNRVKRAKIVRFTLC